MTVAARRLPTRLVEKVWGRDVLPPPFCAPEGKRIGEIWFEPPAELSGLLVKYLFTSEKLSVQVHPSDEAALGDEVGKEECWLILDAEPGAQLAIGFDREHSRETIETAARDGSIEELLSWHDVNAGDVFYLPAGTVHAIGAGISLVEVQQNSDTTFRLYDYGRPRELHLDRALAIANCGPYPASEMGSVGSRGQTLIDGKHFRLDRIVGTPCAETCESYRSVLLALPLDGSIAAEGAKAVSGECLYAQNIDLIDFSAAKTTLLLRPTSV